MKIQNVEIYGLEQAIVASGYPMKWEPITEMKKPTEKDFKRAGKLGKTPIGSGHNNFLKGIVVQFDLTVPIKVWTQLQRYHWFEIVSSCATMHQLKNMDLGNSYSKYVEPQMVAIMKEIQFEYNQNPTEENFLRLIYSNPVGMLLTARVSTTYLQFKTIYSQRHNHRLPDQRGLCKWIETLPYVKDFGVV